MTYITVKDAKLDVEVAQSSVGDDFFFSMRLGPTAAGTAETPGEVLDRILFFPTRFILDPTKTDIFDVWYPGGLPFSETTVTLKWSSDIKEPVILFIKNRSVITVVMPLNVENPTGEFLRLVGEGKIQPPIGTVDTLLHLDNGVPAAAYFHYMFGGNTLQKRLCMRAMAWDPRGFLHSIAPGNVVASVTDPANPTTPPTTPRKPVRFPRANDAADGETGDALLQKIRTMSMTLQINLNQMEPDPIEPNASTPILPRCNAGQAVYDPVTNDFVLNGQHYTMANWPQ